MQAMRVKIPAGETRTAEQIREHYEIEKELAARLRNSTKEERVQLYTAVYDEMFRRVPYHPALVSKASEEQARGIAMKQMNLLRRYVRPDMTFLEVGPGDCALSLEMAKHVKKVYAIDVSTVLSDNSKVPDNFELVISDGCSVNVEPGSVDLAYSNQLMEHLHPDDAAEQLQNIYRALKPGAKYICVTPNGLSGPHDVSLYFDTEATGFHLKEYSITELSALFLKQGFTKTWVILGAKGKFFPIPLPMWPFRMLEARLVKMSPEKRTQVARKPIMQLLLMNRIVAQK